MIIRVTDPSHAGEARRHAATLAGDAKLNDRDAGALAIVVTELATNQVKHAGGGMIVVESVELAGVAGVRTFALDKGPGIRDLNAALRDGYSSAGTPGNGLGAIKRLSHSFDIFSAPDLGTAIVSEFWRERKAKAHVLPLELGVLSIPIKGEEVCGDGAGAKKMGDSMMMMVVDGLGHGILAAEAAREAENVFVSSRTESPGLILEDSHNALKKTRGAAMAVASINLAHGVLTYAGIGNIGSSIVSPAGSRGMASHNGIVGHQVSKVQEFKFPWEAKSILVMASDGLKTNWDLKAYPGIWNKSAALIAGILVSDFSRERDDVTVLVAKEHSDAGGS
jgi:anti-sigma regulatory factor (Ser/Thr protein kinase)